jgi:hypothetical protein
MKKQEKINRLKEILPIFWNSYQHMYDARERKAKGMIDFLLVISTFLPVLVVALYSTDLLHHWLILLPILPQLTSLIILLKYFVVGTPAVHWFKLDKDLLESLNNGDFEIYTIATLKKLENFTKVSMDSESNLIKKSRELLLFSIFLLSFSSLFIFFNGNISLYISVLLLIFLGYYVYFVY